MKKSMSSLFLLCFGLPLYAEFISSDNMLRGLIHSGSIDVKRLEDIMQQLRYDFDIPTRSLYPYTVINTSGSYRLADSVSGRQITIAASNVTLDMNGCCVSGATNGIVINSGLNNVVVKNGIVSDVTSDGVQINSGCTAITLDGLTVKTAARGVFCSNVTNSVIRNVDLQSSNTGIELNNCHNFVLENCVAQTNKYAGFSLVSSTTCLLLDCQSLSTGQNNTDLSGNIYGFVNNAGSGTIFNRCIANSTQGLTLTASQSIVAGFALLGTGTQCHTITNSEASNSTSSANGYANSYGIYIGQTFSALTVAAAGSTSENYAGIDVSWSPDGAYIAVPGVVNNPPVASIYSFDRINNTIIRVASSAEINSLSIGWAPGNDMVAAGGTVGTIYLYFFDRISNTIVLRQSLSSGVGSEVRAVAWSYDSRFLASAIRDASISVQTYTYDAVTQQIAIASSYAYGNVNGVAWSPNGQYLALAGSGSTNQLQIFQVNLSNGTIGSPFISVNVGTGETLAAVAWSPDGNYIAVTGSGSAIGNTRIYRFNGSSVTLTAQVDTATPDNDRDEKISWSPDMSYLTVVVPTNVATGFSRLYSFDKGTGALTLLYNLSYTGLYSAAGVRGTNWSPDGGYIAVVGAGLSGLPVVYMLNAIQFCAGNLISGNKVYGNSGGVYRSGAGISGSSITNFIVQNQAYNNPFNYIFVANVFNQLFGLGPTLTQNSAVQQNVPILTPINISQTIDRSLFLLQELVDALI